MSFEKFIPKPPALSPDEETPEEGIRFRKPEKTVPENRLPERILIYRIVKKASERASSLPMNDSFYIKKKFRLSLFVFLSSFFSFSSLFLLI